MKCFCEQQETYKLKVEGDVGAFDQHRGMAGKSILKAVRLTQIKLKLGILEVK